MDVEQLFAFGLPERGSEGAREREGLSVSMRASEIRRRPGGCRPMALGVRVATPSAGSSAALRFGSNRRAQQQQGGGVGRGLALRQASPSSSSSEAPAAVFGEGEAFEACLDFVSTLGPFSSEEAADMLKDAFGWSRQTYWRKRKSEEVPQVRFLSPLFTHTHRDSISLLSLSSALSHTLSRDQRNGERTQKMMEKRRAERT